MGVKALHGCQGFALSRSVNPALTSSPSLLLVLVAWLLEHVSTIKSAGKSHCTDAPTGKVAVTVIAHFRPTDRNIVPRCGNLKAPCSRGQNHFTMSIILIPICLMSDSGVSAISMHDIPEFALTCRISLSSGDILRAAVILLQYIIRSMPCNHNAEPLARCGSRSRHVASISCYFLEMPDPNMTSIHTMQNQRSMRLFRNPWQAQLVHLDCKLENVVETVVALV